jgi:hypothetical protein
MKTLTNKQWIVAFLAIWFVAFLVLWLVWEMSDRDFRWWTMAIYAGVTAVAAFISLGISPSTLCSRIALQRSNQPPSPSDS